MITHAENHFMFQRRSFARCSWFTIVRCDFLEVFCKSIPLFLSYAKILTVTIILSENAGKCNYQLERGSARNVSAVFMTRFSSVRKHTQFSVEKPCNRNNFGVSCCFFRLWDWTVALLAIDCLLYITRKKSPNPEVLIFFIYKKDVIIVIIG